MIVKILQPGLIDGNFFSAQVIWNALNVWAVVASTDQEWHEEQESWPSEHGGMILRLVAAYIPPFRDEAAKRMGHPGGFG
jgi:hypothetical protein